MEIQQSDQVLQRKLSDHMAAETRQSDHVIVRTLALQSDHITAGLPDHLAVETLQSDLVATETRTQQQ